MQIERRHGKIIINKSKYIPSATELKCNGKSITNRRQVSDKFNNTNTKDIIEARKDPMDCIHHENNQCLYLMPVMIRKLQNILPASKTFLWDGMSLYQL